MSLHWTLPPKRVGLALGSDHFAVFGYTPINCPRGRKAWTRFHGGQFIKRKKKTGSRTLRPKVLLLKHHLFFISAPPSYAECVSGGASIDDEGDKKMLGDTSFTPMYPFVNNYQLPSAPPPSFP